MTFGPSSSPDRTGALCVLRCSLVKLEIDVSVRAIGGRSFGACALTKGTICRDGTPPWGLGITRLSAPCGESVFYFLRDSGTELSVRHITSLSRIVSDNSEGIGRFFSTTFCECTQ